MYRVQYKKDYRQLLIVFSFLYTVLHISNCNPCKVRVKSLYNLHLTFKKCFIYAVCKPFYLSKLFIVGNSSTSRIAAESVSSITSRSIPNPMPPVGGIPYSRAQMKSSSR